MRPESDHIGQGLGIETNDGPDGGTMDAAIIEAMAGPAWDAVTVSVPWSSPAIGDEEREDHRAEMRAALAALTSPRTVECETCGGTGLRLGHDPYSQSVQELRKFRCGPCSGSGRIEKGPIAYLAGELEQVGWHNQMHPGEFAHRTDPPVYPWESVYRLPDESPKGGA